MLAGVACPRYGGRVQDVLEHAVAQQRARAKRATIVVYAFAAVFALLPLRQVASGLLASSAADCRDEVNPDSALERSCMAGRKFPADINGDYCVVGPDVNVAGCEAAHSACRTQAVTDEMIDHCVARKRSETLHLAGLFSIMPIAIALIGWWISRSARAKAKMLPAALRPGAVVALNTAARKTRVNGITVANHHVLSLQLRDGTMAELIVTSSDVAAVLEALRARNPECQML